MEVPVLYIRKFPFLSCIIKLHFCSASNSYSGSESLTVYFTQMKTDTDILIINITVAIIINMFKI